MEAILCSSGKFRKPMSDKLQFVAVGKEGAAISSKRLAGQCASNRSLSDVERLGVPSQIIDAPLAELHQRAR